jgi:uncharacterized membrane protein
MDILLAIIVFVVACDIYWTIHNLEIMAEIEKNPVARYLIAEYNGVATLCAVKVLTCGIVVYVLSNLKHFMGRRSALVVAIMVAMSQILLLLYFELGKS